MSNNALDERDKSTEKKHQELKDRIEKIILDDGLNIKLIQDIEISPSSAIVKMSWSTFATVERIVKEIGNSYGSGCIFGSDDGIILHIQLPFEKEPAN